MRKRCSFTSHLAAVLLLAIALDLLIPFLILLVCIRLWAKSHFFAIGEDKHHFWAIEVDRTRKDGFPIIIPYTETVYVENEHNRIDFLSPLEEVSHFFAYTGDKPIPSSLAEEGEDLGPF